MAQGTHEKRDQARIRFDETVSVTFDEFKDFKVDYIENISLGGMYMATDTPLATNSVCTFEIYISDIGQKLSGTAKVVWTKEVPASAEGLPSGMGLKFLTLDDDTEAFIRSFIDKHVPDLDE